VRQQISLTAPPLGLHTHWGGMMLIWFSNQSPTPFGTLNPLWQADGPREPLSLMAKLMLREADGFRGFRPAFGIAAEEKGKFKGGSINVT